MEENNIRKFVNNINETKEFNKQTIITNKLIKVKNRNYIKKKFIDKENYIYDFIFYDGEINKYLLIEFNIIDVAYLKPITFSKYNYNEIQEKLFEFTEIELIDGDRFDPTFIYNFQSFTIPYYIAIRINNGKLIPNSTIIFHYKNEELVYTIDENFNIQCANYLIK